MFFKQFIMLHAVIQCMMDIHSNTGFFTVLGYAPFPMGLSPIRLGLVFTGWGILVAIFAVFGAPRLQASLGIARAMYLNLAAFAVVVLGIAILSTARGLLAQAERVQAERVAGPAPAVPALVPAGGASWPRYASRACWPRPRRTAARRSSARFSSAGSAATKAASCSGGKPATRSDRIAARCAAMR